MNDLNPTQTHLIEIGGEDREIKLGFNALCAFEEVSGIESVSKLAQMGEDDFGLHHTRYLVWAGLVSRDQYSLEDVGNWLEQDMKDGRLEDVIEQVMEALNETFPDVEEAEAGGEGNPEVQDPEATSESA
jgi:hypothetical protein